MSVMRGFTDNLGRRAFAAIGGALVSAFGPSIVPDPYEPWLVAVGIFIMAVAVFWPWLVRHVAWRFALRPPLAGEAAAGPVDETAGAALRKRLLNAIIDPKQLYIAEISASAGRLEEEHILEFGFRFFNASQKHLALSQLRGTIECVMTDPYGSAEHIDLPPPVLLERGANLNDIAPLTETMIVLQQHLTPKLTAALQEALQREGLQFYFDELGILMTGSEDRTAVTVVPIDSGVFLRDESGVRWGRIVRARVEAAL